MAMGGLSHYIAPVGMPSPVGNDAAKYHQMGLELANKAGDSVVGVFKDRYKDYTDEIAQKELTAAMEKMRQEQIEDRDARFAHEDRLAEGQRNFLQSIYDRNAAAIKAAEDKAKLIDDEEQAIQNRLDINNSLNDLSISSTGDHNQDKIALSKKIAGLGEELQYYGSIAAQHHKSHNFVSNLMNKATAGIGDFIGMDTTSFEAKRLNNGQKILDILVNIGMDPTSIKKGNIDPNLLSQKFKKLDSADQRIVLEALEKYKASIPENIGLDAVKSRAGIR
jgi:hypothetical protein